MVLLEELIVWFAVGIITLFAGIQSFLMYRKLPILPYAFQTAALWCISGFGFFLYLGRSFDIYLFLQIAVILFCLSLNFYFKFFRELFGTFRKYGLIQFGMSAAFGFIVAMVFLTPPIITNTNMQLTLLQTLGILAEVTLFAYVVIDYTQFSLRKIIKEHLSMKLSYFSIIIITSILSTAIPMLLYLLGKVPIYVPFLVQIVFIMIILVFLVKYPYFNFLVLLNPQLLTILHGSGLKIYSYQFQPIKQEELFGGAMTALNSLFKESFAHEGIEQLHFRGKIVYSSYRKEFSIIYIDNIHSSFLSRVVQEFTEHFAKTYGSLLKEWDGNVGDFGDLEKDVRRFFYFLPQFIN
jgi:hypothetical protein